jgi:hypothetical protein
MSRLVSEPDKQNKTKQNKIQRTTFSTQQQDQRSRTGVAAPWTSGVMGIGVW